MSGLPLGGAYPSNNVTVGTNLNFGNVSITNASITEASIGQLKTGIFNPNTINTSIINASQLNLPPDYVIPILNVSTLNSQKDNFSNVSATNISATNISAISITAPNVQPLLSAGENINISGNTISATGLLPSVGNFSQIFADNLSTGDMTIGNKLTLSNKTLSVNSTANVTQNSGDLITSGAVYSAINGAGGGDSRSLTNTQIIPASLITKPSTSVNAGTSGTIMLVNYDCKFGDKSYFHVVANFNYIVGGYGEDAFIAKLRYSSQGTVTIDEKDQIWRQNDGGGTRSGVLSPLIGNVLSGVSAGTEVAFSVLIENNSDDTFDFVDTTVCSFTITESIPNDGSNDLNLNTGDLQADAANFNSLSIQAGSGSGKAVIGRTQIGNDAFGNMMAISINGNVAGNNYGFAQVANNQTIMNAMPGAYNSFRVQNQEVASIGTIGLGIGLGVNNTAAFPLQVAGSALINDDLFVDEVDANSANIDNISCVNLSAQTMTIQDITILGNLNSNLNFSTANLIPGDNININSSGVITAFVGSDSIVNLNALHVDTDLNVGGVLNVSLTSTFQDSLNVSNIIYSGVAGQHEGGLVLYSNITGNNFTQSYNSSGEQMNISATGTTNSINYFVGNSNQLTITSTGIETSNLQSATLEADVFECIDGEATFRFTTPLLNATNANISLLTLDELDLDELDLDTINASQTITDELIIKDPNTIQTTTLKRESGATKLETNGAELRILISSTTAGIVVKPNNVVETEFLQNAKLLESRNISTDVNVSVGGSLSAVGSLEADEGNFSTFNFIAGVGDDLDIDDLVVNNTLNTSDFNASSVVSKTGNMSSLVLDKPNNEPGGPGLLVTGNTKMSDVYISRTLFFEGSDAYIGTVFGATPIFAPPGTLPRHRLNFYSGGTLTGEIGVRFGVNSLNECELKLEKFGNVSVFNINICNISTLDMDNASTTIHNTLNVGDMNSSDINCSSIDTFDFNLKDQTSPAQAMTMVRDGGATTITNPAGNIIINTNINSTDRAMIIGQDNIIQTRTIQNAGLMETRNFSTDENVSVAGSLSVDNTIETNTLNVSSFNFIAGVGDDLDVDDLVVNNAINTSSINSNSIVSSQANISNLVLEGTYGVTPALFSDGGECRFSDVNVSRTFFFSGTDSYIGSVFSTPPIFAPPGTAPRSRLNFYGGPDGFRDVALRFGINSSNVVEMQINEYGYTNVSMFKINISNISTLSMDNVSTTIHNILNANTFNSSLINASNISGYQQTLIAGDNISIVGNTISSAGEPLPTNPNFSSVTAETSNFSNMNTSFIICKDEASFENNITVSGMTSCDLLDTDELFTIDAHASTANISNLSCNNIRSFVYNISDSLDDTEASIFIRNGNLTEFINTSGRLRFSCDEIQSSGVVNFSTINASVVNGDNLSTASLKFSSDFVLDSFSNTLSLAETAEEAVQDIETNGLNTTSVNTSQLNVDGFSTLDTVAISIGLNSTNNNLFNINSSGTFNTSTLNVSTINASNISGYQETLIAGDNISIVGNTISSTGGSGTTIDSTTDLNCSTLTTVGNINVGGIILAPNQISFRATYIGNYIVINSNIKLPYNVATRNIGGGYSTSTYEFTAPVSGSYFFHASIFRDFASNDENNLGVDFILNNGSTATIIQRIENKGYQIHNGTIVTFMNAGERVYVQRSFGRIALVGQTNNQYITFFGYLIG